MIELTNGNVMTGVLVRESASALLIRTGDNPDKPVAVPKAQVANRAASTVSLMPPGCSTGSRTIRSPASSRSFRHRHPRSSAVRGPASVLWCEICTWRAEGPYRSDQWQTPINCAFFSECRVSPSRKDTAQRDSALTLA